MFSLKRHRRLPAVCIVHDWFEEYSGAEKVSRRILDIFPNAKIFSIVNFMDDETEKYFGHKEIKTSFIQKLPFARRKFRSYLGLFPLAIEQHNVSDYDVIIASAHNVSKGVLTNRNQILVCYCHSPIRYVWDFYHRYTQQDIGGKVKRVVAKMIIHYMRMWDFQAAQRVDYFVANSKYVQQRIQKNYRRDSTVIYPPVDTHKYRDLQTPDDYYLTISRLVAYKNLDVIVKAFAKGSRKLKVIGQGGQMKRLKRLAKTNPNIEFTGFVDEEKKIELISKAKAFVFASEEDFGISPVEAQSAGVPVIAYGRGGVLETVIPGKTGLFYGRLDSDELKECIDSFEENETVFDRNAIQKHAQQFSADRFKTEMKEFILENCTVNDYQKFTDQIDSAQIAR